MALSWTMDKIGPIARGVEDCALILSVIYGPDGQDRSVKDAAFNWDAEFAWKTLRVGFLQNEFEVPAKAEGESAEQKRDFADRVYDAKYGVSGAQPADVLLQVMQKAHDDNEPLTIVTGESASCDDDSCAI